MEAELIPMCEDQGMAIVSWASLGGGHLQTTKQKEDKEKNPDARPPRGPTEADAKVSEALEKIADSKNTSLQAVVSFSLFGYDSRGQLTTNKALAYLLHQSTYVFPIVGVQTVEHIKAMPEALGLELSKEDIQAIQRATEFKPQFPVSFLYNFRGDQPYSLSHTASNNQQYQMAAWIQAPPKLAVSQDSTSFNVE
jgi:aryl-alcohol dehydrogenase-like predicted oxidoreductase